MLLIGIFTPQTLGERSSKLSKGVIHKPRGQNFGYYDTSPPSWSLLQHMACYKMVIWLTLLPLNCPRGLWLTPKVNILARFWVVGKILLREVRPHQDAIIIVSICHEQISHRSVFPTYLPYGVIHKPHVENFEDFWPPPPSWSLLLLNEAYVLK